MFTQFCASLTGARLTVCAVIAAALFAGGIVAAWCTPMIGAAAQLAAKDRQIAQWRRGYDNWRAYGLAEKRAFDRSETLRRLEQGAAGEAVANLDAQCTARIEAARQSAAAITKIITKEPTYDKAGCPVRSIADPVGVRDALRPQAAARG